MPDDLTGEATVRVLDRSLEILSRITGNDGCSLGLHPAVYFYNERGRYNRFLFLGVTALLTEKVSNNDGGFFKKFTMARQLVEAFLVDNKSLIAYLLQNISKGQRVPRIKQMFEFLIATAADGRPLVMEEAIASMGLRGRILDVSAIQTSPFFSDDVKSTLFINSALTVALKCPICNGYLHTTKSVSYDHVQPRREGGTGDVSNGQLVHPYCNTAVKG